MSSVEICVPKVVIAELMQGAKTEKELAAIEAFAEAFTIIDQTDTSWLQAGRLAYSLKRKGSAVNQVDCYIAVLAKENRCSILSLDIHFTCAISRHLRQTKGLLANELPSEINVLKTTTRRPQKFAP